MCPTLSHDLQTLKLLHSLYFEIQDKVCFREPTCEKPMIVGMQFIVMAQHLSPGLLTFKQISQKTCLYVEFCDYVCLRETTSGKSMFVRYISFLKRLFVPPPCDCLLPMNFFHRLHIKVCIHVSFRGTTYDSLVIFISFGISCIS